MALDQQQCYQLPRSLLQASLSQSCQLPWMPLLLVQGWCYWDPELVAAATQHLGGTLAVGVLAAMV